MRFGLQDRKYDVFGGGAAVGGIAQAAGSVAAAGIQASAANHAADLSSQAAANSLQFNKDVFNTQQTNAAPFLQAGQTAVGQLSQGTQPGGQFTQTYGKTFDGGPAFSAPTTVDEQNDPGYQFRLQQGQQALERSAAAKGGVMGGGVLKDLTNYAQGAASQEYGNVYSRALQGYQTNFNSNLAQFDSNYNQFNTDQSTQYNRLASLAGVGQTANGQLNSAGSAAASNYSNTAMAGASGAGNYLTQGANAIAGGISGVNSAYQNYNALQQYGTNYGTNNGQIGVPGSAGYVAPTSYQDV